MWGCWGGGGLAVGLWHAWEFVQIAGGIRVFIVGLLHRQALGFMGMDVRVKIAEILGEGGGCEKWAGEAGGGICWEGSTRGTDYSMIFFMDFCFMFLTYYIAVPNNLFE